MKFRGFPRSVCFQMQYGNATANVLADVANPLLDVADPLSSALGPLSGLLGGGGGPGGSATLNPNQYNSQANSNSSFGPQTITNNSLSLGSTFQPQGFNPGYNTPISNNPGVQPLGTNGYNPQSLSGGVSSNPTLDGFAKMVQSAGGAGMAVGSPYYNAVPDQRSGSAAMATVPNTGNSTVPQQGDTNNLSDLLARSQQPQQATPFAPPPAPASNLPDLGDPQAWNIPQNPPSANILARYPDATANASSSGTVPAAMDTPIWTQYAQQSQQVQPTPQPQTAKMPQKAQIAKRGHGAKSTSFVPPPPPQIASAITEPPLFGNAEADAYEAQLQKEYQAKLAQHRAEVAHDKIIKALPPEEQELIRQFREQKKSQNAPDNGLLHMEQAQYDNRANTQNFDGSPQAVAQSVLPAQTPPDDNRPLTDGILDPHPEIKNIVGSLENRIAKEQAAVTDDRPKTKEAQEKAEAHAQTLENQANTFDPSTGLYGVYTSADIANIRNAAENEYIKDHPKPGSDKPDKKGLLHTLAKVAEVGGETLFPNAPLAERYREYKKEQKADLKTDLKNWEANKTKAIEDAVKMAKTNLPIAAKMAQQHLANARKNSELAEKNYEFQMKEARIKANQSMLSDIRQMNLTDKQANTKLRAQRLQLANKIENRIAGMEKDKLELSKQRIAIANRMATTGENNYALRQNQQDFYQGTMAPNTIAYMQSGKDLNQTKIDESRAKTLTADADNYKFPMARTPNEKPSPELIQHYRQSGLDPEELRKKFYERGYASPLPQAPFAGANIAPHQAQEYVNFYGSREKGREAAKQDMWNDY